VLYFQGICSFILQKQDIFSRYYLKNGKKSLPQNIYSLGKILSYSNSDDMPCMKLHNFVRRRLVGNGVVGAEGQSQTKHKPATSSTQEKIKRVYQKARSALLGLFLFTRLFGSGVIQNIPGSHSSPTKASMDTSSTNHIIKSGDTQITFHRNGIRTKSFVARTNSQKGIFAQIPTVTLKKGQGKATVTSERLPLWKTVVFRCQKFLSGVHISTSKRDSLLLLFTTAMITPICKNLNLSPILGFLAVGALIGPTGLKLINNVHTTEKLAELGVVFFLFELGLELSVDRLMQMSQDVFGLGLSQYVLTAAAIFFALKLLTTLSPAALITIGGGLALSSSAFVLQLLKDRQDIGTRYGKAAFGILLLQDLAVVPLLVALPLLAGTGGSVWMAIKVAVAKAMVCLTTIALLGKYAVNPMFYIVASSRSQEALVSIILTTALGMSALSQGLGLSDTLGAFLAGILLGETKYRYQVEAEVAPFRGVLLGLFFMTVGFSIDLQLIMNNLPLVVGAVGGILALKAAVISLLCLAFGLSLSNAQQVGLVLSQGGEFAFVAFGLAKRLGILNSFQTKLLMTSVALTMATTPALSQLSASIADFIESKKGFTFYMGQDKEGQQLKSSPSKLVVVCGYGAVGKMVCDLLDKKFIKYLCFDIDPKKTIEARNKGLPVFYGDVSRPAVLEAFHVGDARAVIITTTDVRGTNRIALTLRKEFPNLKIFVRARNMQHRDRLKALLNVDAMVPVLKEHNQLVTLPFAGAALEAVGVSRDEVSTLLQTMRLELMQIKGDDDDVEIEEAMNELDKKKESSTPKKKEQAAPKKVEQASQPEQVNNVVVSIPVPECPKGMNEEQCADHLKACLLDECEDQDRSPM